MEKRGVLGMQLQRLVYPPPLNIAELHSETKGQLQYNISTILILYLLIYNDLLIF